MKIFGNKTEIVGVVENGKYTAVSEEPTPALFVPIFQMGNEQMCMLVRSDRDSNQVPRRTRCHPPSRSQPAYLQPGQLARRPGDHVVAVPAAATALALFGALGILLAITGIFGLASYTVSRRMKELGIRVALGASHTQVLRAALHRPIVLLGFGSFAGLILGVLASRILASIVYQATPNDPLC